MKILQIKKSAEFQKISKKNEKFYSRTVLLLSANTPSLYFQDIKNNKNAKDFCRVGYTVSKVVGNAVIRNKAKRRLREAVRELMPKYGKLYKDYILIARKEIALANYQDILKDLSFCLKKSI